MTKDQNACKVTDEKLKKAAERIIKRSEKRNGKLWDADHRKRFVEGFCHLHHIFQRLENEYPA